MSWDPNVPEVVGLDWPLRFVPGALRALSRKAERDEDWAGLARDLRTVADRIDEARREGT